MKIVFISVAAFLFNCVQCFDSESLEYNGVEASPLYETIIYSDLANILNEFEHNNEANNESESNEDIQDLLSEYHHYLEKAHKQRVNYLEKNKPKNKVPIIRHEKFTKMKSPATNKYDYFKNSFFKPEHNFPQALNPFSMFIPFNPNKYVTTSTQPPFNNDLSASKNIIFNDENPISAYSSVPFKPPCCKDGRSACKHCFMSLDGVQQRVNPIVLNVDDEKNYNLNNPISPERLDDTINVRIKVDVQLPKLQQDHIQFYNPQGRDKISDYDVGVSKEYLSAIKLPSPYLNFPAPLNLFGYNKISSKNNKHDMPISQHKITVHKKKKSKVGNTNKKHRKKVITIHNIKIEPELSLAMFNMSVNDKNKTDYDSTFTLNLSSNKTLKPDGILNAPTTANVENLNNETQTEENVLLLVNITNNIDNGTNENHKTENSIETDYTNAIILISNKTTEKPFHLIKKREISTKNKSTASKIKHTTPQIITKQSISTAHKNITVRNKPKKRFMKKISAKSMAHKATKTNSTLLKLEKTKVINKKLDKSLPTDSELLYWPNANNITSKDIMKNITAIILENENKKGKLNMTTETMHRNRTRALEQAIFGDVDWNDVDAVAPAFISFVGKYTEGILTFCNERICHSMKCTKQKCLHRVCALKDRFNKGHCTGSNYTDSVASMASIMDLPSNIAFEIVDILQDRMIGKLFGKITLCINTKCITFAASKKVFEKYKCVNTEKVKELDLKGHCIQAKVS